MEWCEEAVRVRQSSPVGWVNEISRLPEEQGGWSKTHHDAVEGTPQDELDVLVQILVVPLSRLRDKGNKSGHSLLGEHGNDVMHVLCEPEGGSVPRHPCEKF